MGREDLEEIIEIERASFSMPWPRRGFETELDREYASAFVLREKRPGQVIILAYLCVWFVLDEVHILNLAVRPSARRQGHARRLIEHVMDHYSLKQATRFVLEVRATNRAAITLYRSCGFSQWGVKSRYYADTGEDALLMGREAPFR